MNSNTQRYSDAELNSLTQVELEARALVRVASALNYVKENWEAEQGNLGDALEKNRRLWAIFAGGVSREDSQISNDIKVSILNLANYVFKRSIDLLLEAKPEDLDSLIDINMNIARGLTEMPSEEAMASIAKQEAEKQSSSEEKSVSNQEVEDKEDSEYDDIFGS